MIDLAHPDAPPLPCRFGPLPGYGRRDVIRRPWAMPAAASGSGWCCQCVEEDANVDWEEAAAPYVLREPEWRLWRRLGRTDARRRWMRGRVAAKDAVRLLLLDRYHVAATLETIGILPNAQGQPQVTCKALPDGGRGVVVSISHSGNGSVALAAERSARCRGVGIDVASRQEDHDGLAEGGFVSAETALLADCPTADRGDWLLRLWCAKEAVGKALGLGLMGNPLNYIVRRIDVGQAAVDVEPDAQSVLMPALGRPGFMTAHVGCDGALAFAVARLEER